MHIAENPKFNSSEESLTESIAKIQVAPSRGNKIMLNHNNVLRFP